MPSSYNVHVYIRMEILQLQFKVEQQQSVCVGEVHGDVSGFKGISCPVMQQGFDLY